MRRLSRTTTRPCRTTHPPSPRDDQRCLVSRQGSQTQSSKTFGQKGARHAGSTLAGRPGGRAWTHTTHPPDEHTRNHVSYVKPKSPANEGFSSYCGWTTTQRRQNDRHATTTTTSTHPPPRSSQHDALAAKLQDAEYDGGGARDQKFQNHDQPHPVTTRAHRHEQPRDDNPVAAERADRAPTDSHDVSARPTIGTRH